MFAKFFLILAGTSLVVLLGLGVPASVSQLYASALSGMPYWVPQHAVLLYVVSPAVAVSASVLLLFPGLVLALVFRRQEETLSLWVIRGWLISIPISILSPILPSAILGAPVTGAAFVAVLAVNGFIALLIMWGVDRRARVDRRFLAAGKADIVQIILVPVLTLLILSPKFFWESFNGDGGHVFQAARALYQTGYPGWVNGAGQASPYPPVIWMDVVPASWFLRLFGDLEFAARMSILLGLALLTAAVLEMVRFGRKAQLGFPARLAIGFGLIFYAATLAFQFSYNPYHADLLSPGAREPLVMVSFLGFVLFLEKRQYFWAATALFVLCFSIPSAPMLAILWIAGRWATDGFRSGRHVKVSLFLGALVLLGSKSIVWALYATNIFAPVAEFDFSGISQRLRFITLLDFNRLWWWIVPAGLVPAAALFAWRWQDNVSRALALVTISYVGFFYVQAYRVLPHHFAPAIILAMIVFWRMPRTGRQEVAASVVACPGLVLAMLLSWPSDIRPHLDNRLFAQRIGYSSNIRDPARKNFALEQLFPIAFPGVYSDAEIGLRRASAPLAWAAYMRTDATQPADLDFEIVDAGAPSQFADPLIVADAQGLSLIASSEAVYQRALTMPDQQHSLRNPLFHVPREYIFGRGVNGRNGQVWDLARIVGLR